MPDKSIPERAGITLYHGTNAEFASGDIETGRGMFGIHLSTDAGAAGDYGKNVKAYTLAPDAKMLCVGGACHRGGERDLATDGIGRSGYASDTDEESN